MQTDMGLSFRAGIFTIICAALLLMLTIQPVSADHEDGHYDITLEEEYFYPIILTYDDDAGVELIITSSKDIDILLLTPEMYADCCSTGEMNNIDYLKDGGSQLSTQDYSYVVENGVGPRYLIIDHTSNPSGGALPSGSVTVDLYLYELPENVFQFHWQNLILSLLLIPPCILLVVDAVIPGTTKKILRNPKIIQFKDQILNNRIPMTLAFIGFNTLLLLLRTIFSPEKDTFMEYLEWGAMASGSVFDGNFLGILTSNFFHFDIIHLVGNMFAIYILGRYLEPKYGSLRFLGILMAGGFVASMLSLFYDPYTASGGASGMVFCAFGVVLMELILDKLNSTKHIYCQWHDLQWFWGTMFLNVVISFAPGVSLLGHLGGLLGGLGIVFAMVRLETHPTARSDQLLNCKKCQFSLPITDTSELELSVCPKCGEELFSDSEE